MGGVKISFFHHVATFRFTRVFRQSVTASADTASQLSLFSLGGCTEELAGESGG